MADLAFLTERMRLGFGADLVVDQVAAGLAQRGHDVTVYASYEDGTYADRPYRLVSFGVPVTRWAATYDLRAWRQAHGAQLTSVHHDLFCAATPPFFSLLPSLREKGFAIEFGVSDWKGFPRSTRFNFRYSQEIQQRFLFRYAARLLPISQFLADELPERLRAKATPILLGADHYPLADEGAGAEIRTRLGLSDDEVMILYVGRLNPDGQPYKGTAELVEVAAQLRAELPQARLVMAGFGTEADGDWVRSHGALAVVNAPVDDMPSLFAAADIYVTASKWEGFDLPLVEAQRAGAPVVAYRAGAHPEVVDDGVSGTLVHSRDELLSAVRELVLDPDRRAAMGVKAREWAGRFRWEETVEGYDRVVHELLTRQ